MRRSAARMAAITGVVECPCGVPRGCAAAPSAGRGRPGTGAKLSSTLAQSGAAVPLGSLIFFAAATTGAAWSSVLMGVSSLRTSASLSAKPVTSFTSAEPRSAPCSGRSGSLAGSSRKSRKWSRISLMSVGRLLRLEEQRRKVVAEAVALDLLALGELLGQLAVGVPRLAVQRCCRKPCRPPRRVAVSRPPRTIQRTTPPPPRTRRDAAANATMAHRAHLPRGLWPPPHPASRRGRGRLPAPAPPRRRGVGSGFGSGVSLSRRTGGASQPPGSTTRGPFAAGFVFGGGRLRLGFFGRTGSGAGVGAGAGDFGRHLPAHGRRLEPRRIDRRSRRAASPARR